MEYRSILIVKPGPDSTLTLFKKFNLKRRDKFVASVDNQDFKGRSMSRKDPQYSVNNGKVKG